MTVGEGRASLFPAERSAFWKRRSRRAFFRSIPSDAKVLEIGPGFRPCMVGPGVKYLDILDARALAEGATAFNKDASRVPRIDYVSSAGDLSIVDERFEFVISSHCIEHQPDLIRHLREVERLLEPGGCYALVIPDRRFCFDHYLRDSAVEDVVQAFREQRKVHTFNSVVEHRALTIRRRSAAANFLPF